MFVLGHNILIPHIKKERDSYIQYNIALSLSKKSCEILDIHFKTLNCKLMNYCNDIALGHKRRKTVYDSSLCSRRSPH